MRRLLPNRGSSGAGRCGPSTSPTCDQQRRSLVRPTPRTKHHRTKENPAHASQHAQVEERQAQRQTKSTEEGSSGVQNCASNLQQQKRAAESNSSTRSTEKTLRSQSLQSQGTIANSTKTPSPPVASHDTRGAQPAKRPDATSRTHRIRVCDACASATSASTQEETGVHLRCQRSSDPNRHLRLCGVETACTFRPSALRLRAAASRGPQFASDAGKTALKTVAPPHVVTP